MMELEQFWNKESVAPTPTSPSQEDDGDTFIHPSLFCERNPMLNPVVLTRLFDLCNLSDLPRLRLVSKEWHSRSLTHFRKEMWAVIHYYNNTWTPNCLDWESLKDDLDLGRKPFRNFRIMRVEFGRPFKEKLSTKYRNMGQFWKKYGRWIHKLHIYSAEIHSMKAFEKAIFKETPNLEELHLGRLVDSKKWRKECATEYSVQPNLKSLVVENSDKLPYPWEEFFINFPNIQNLEITAFCDPHLLYNKQMHFTAISEYLRLRAKEHTKLKIRDLEMSIRTSEDFRTATRILQIPRIMLPKLSFSFENNAGLEEEEVQLLSKLFLLHGTWLENLAVTTSRVSTYANFPSQPGPFTSVVSLELSGNCVRNLHFLEQFPNLKVLKLVNSNENILEDTDYTKIEGIKLHQLTEFRLNLNIKVDNILSEKCMTEEVMEVLVRVMPNVKSFFGNLSNSSLRVVCREWKQLTELRVASYPNDQGRLDDEGITGIVAGVEERMPNITDLKELKYLTIGKGKKISDASVWQGFLKMAHLQILTVELSAETFDQSYRALVKKFPLGDNKITRLWRAQTENHNYHQLYWDD